MDPGGTYFCYTFVMTPLIGVHLTMHFVHPINNTILTQECGC